MMKMKTRQPTQCRWFRQAFHRPLYPPWRIGKWTQIGQFVPVTLSKWGDAVYIWTSQKYAPGIPLTVDILGDKRTVMNYIITPIEKSWKSAFREQ